MKFLFIRFIVLLFLITTFFFACRPKGHSNESVELAMQQYNKYILKMDVDSIASATILLCNPDHIPKK